MPKGKKRNPQNKGNRKPKNKGATKKPTRARKGFAITGKDRRKIDAINKKLSEFFNVFGEYSSQYQDLRTVVLTQLGGIYNPKSRAFDDVFSSTSPLRLSTDSGYIELLLFGGRIDRLYGYFKGTTVLKEARKIEGFKDIRTKKELEERKSQIKENIVVSGLNKIRDYELQQLISYLPQFYSALDQMDTYASEDFTQRFSEYGVIRKKEEPDRKKSEGERLITDILKYFDKKQEEGNAIKNGTFGTTDSSIIESLKRHQPVKLKFVDDSDDDGEDDDIDWSTVKI